MKTLISPAEVVRIAFGAAEPLSPEAVAEADIAAAEQRYIVPVIGPSLHERLLAGAYPDFRAAYLAAPAALFTRVAIQPRLDVRTGQCGTTAPKSSLFQPADATARRALVRSLRAQARTLLHRAAEHLAAHADDYPEYEAGNNPLTRCSIDGNLVQTR